MMPGPALPALNPRLTTPSTPPPARIDGRLRQLSLAVVGLGLFAACMLYGDGMITPAISVLSAVEGIGIITPYVLPMTIAILIGLFLIQRHGATHVGGLFGPVILVWLLFLGVTGNEGSLRTGNSRERSLTSLSRLTHIEVNPE